MNFQQLRYVREIVRQNMNLTAAANALFTSQPGVSKQVAELESELGIAIFVRHGKRLIDLTPPGRAVLGVIERLLEESDKLRRVADEFVSDTRGSLTIATTHTQARYVLPPAVSAFKKRFPDVHLALVQATPPHIAQMLAHGTADIGIATETLAAHSDLVALRAYEWEHVVVAPHAHPLMRRAAGSSTAQSLTLQALANHPIVTYDTAFTGRSHIDQAFSQADLSPDIVLTAIDSDVIKTYVSLGLGVGIIAAMAFDPLRDGLPDSVALNANAGAGLGGLAALPAGHLFGKNITRLAVRKNAFLRGFAYAFIEQFVPALTRPVVEQALEQAARKP